MKINNRKLLLIAVLSISGFWLNSCQGLSKQNVALTPTSSLTHTNSPTQILTLTSTSTVTPTITISPTITSTFTTTPAYTLPGLYYFYKCVDFIPKGINLTINFCVQSVKVNTDLTMRFNVYWKTYYEIGNHLIKRGIENDKNFYITDNLGKKYNAIGWGGNVAQDAIVSKTPTAGWFIFPVAQPGATSFTFWDMYDMFSIDGIVLPQGNLPASMITPMPTLGSYNSPGTYYIYKCTSFVPQRNFPGASKVTLCVTVVHINADNEMQFSMSWTIYIPRRDNYLKPADVKYYDMYLQDNFNNKYQYIYAKGCAVEDTWVIHDNTQGVCVGLFLFPKAKPDATSFQFIDPANGATIDNIVMLPE